MYKKIIYSFLIVMVSMTFYLPVSALNVVKVDVGYQVKTSVWFDYAWGGALGGSEGADPLTALEINLDSAPYGAGIEYRVYTQSGWLDWTPSFGIAGNGDAILGVQIQLTDFEYANVYYQTYRKGLGWGTWQANGSTSGQLNADNPITGIRVQVDEIGVEYQSNVGGTEAVLRHNNETQSSGLIYTIKMGLISSAADDKLEYRAYFKNSGWTNWVSNMSVLGSERGGDYITALEARLVGLDQYHLSIQPQVNGTWWDFTYDGQTAGTYDQPLSAYRIQIVRDAPIIEKSINLSTNIKTTNCPITVESNEVALWTNDTDLFGEDSFLDSYNAYFLNDIYYYDFTNDGSITSFLIKDNNLETLSFASSDMVYACFGSNIADDIGFNYKEYALNEAEYYNAYYNNYVENYTYVWYWYLFDVGIEDGVYVYRQFNQFVPPIS